MTELDNKILDALDGKSVGGVEDFAGSESAIRKAKSVLEIARESNFDIKRVSFVSVGGADGTEIEYLLSKSEASYGILLEYDDALCQKARVKADNLCKLKKEMRVFTGDAVQKIDPALKTVEAWHDFGSVFSMVVSMHAVLHELPDRGARNQDLEAFLQKFIWRDMPVLIIAREPCAPRDFPETVYISADCSPKLLVDFASFIRKSHTIFQEKPDPVAMANCVRMDYRLAVETIVKLFYIESFAYEIEERITSFTRDELLRAFRRVFGNENVRHEDLQSDSFDRFWSQLGLKIADYEMRELSKPQLHMRIVAKWFPETSKSKKNGHPDLHPTDEIEDGIKLDPTSSVFEKPKGKSVIMHTWQKRGISAANKDLPDLLTPGFTADQIGEIYKAEVGTELSNILSSCFEDAIQSVAEGDFRSQVRIGEQIAEYACECPEFKGVGLYFCGEGWRLLGDLENDSEKRNNAYNQAEENYNKSIECSPDDPRPIRGLGRLYELRGCFDEALMNFDKAKGLALLGHSNPLFVNKRHYFAHELLRITRHNIYCLLDVKETNPYSKWHREHKSREIEGYIIESENRHREHMMLFKTHDRWYQIEWFMGLVFLAKAWASMKNQERMIYCLLHALLMRRKMFKDQENLGKIERANLQWWLDVSSSSGMRLNRTFERGIEKLRYALMNDEHGEVIKIIDDILIPISPPWELNII